MITYLLIGTIWTMLVEFYIRPKFTELEEMNWLTKFFNILLWPLNIGLFIYGFLFGSNSDED